MDAHQPYQKVFESTRSWGAVRLRGKWVATEKVHGANFCVAVAVAGGGQVGFAKRGAALAADEDFYSFRASDLPARLEPAVRALAAEHPGAARVAVYGELFGGHYPHEDVPEAAAPIRAVQTGVWYAPGLEFMAFDVCVDGAYLEFDDAQAACERHGLLFAQPLARGSFEEMTEFPLGFDTTLPARLGLPPLPAGTNKAEGVVVRPVRSFAVGESRPLLKRKIDQFSETKYDEAVRPRPAGAGAGAGAACSERDLVRLELLARATPARLANALSKIGALPADAPPAQMREALRAFRVDVLEDMQREGIATADELRADLEMMGELTEALKGVMVSSCSGRA